MCVKAKELKGFLEIGNHGFKADDFFYVPDEDEIKRVKVNRREILYAGIPPEEEYESCDVVWLPIEKDLEEIAADKNLTKVTLANFMKLQYLPGQKPRSLFRTTEELWLTHYLQSFHKLIWKNGEWAADSPS